MNKFINKINIPTKVECRWFNEELKRIKNEKINAYNKAKITNNIDDWEEYKIIRNQYVDDLRKAENDFYSKTISDNRGDQKKMWKTLKEIMGKSKKSDINAIESGNDIITDKKEIAEKFNKYFVESIIEINDSIGAPNANLNTATNYCESTFKFRRVEIEDIKTAIKKSKARVTWNGLNQTFYWIA